MRRHGLIALALVAALLPGAAGAGEDEPKSSEWPCGHWGMYGRSPDRTFSTDPCPSPITPETVATLAPAWFFETERTVTASPAVVEGTAYVGDWSGTMYAVDADTGEEIWSTPTEPAPGAAFGPIVSSAAVAEAPLRGPPEPVVIFGAGPRVYALRASDGSVAWEAYVGATDDGGDPVLSEDPVQVESSPVVHDGIVYVGMDPHNHPDSETGGVRGGLLALRAHDGKVLRKFEPDPNGLGCGGVWSSPTLDPDRGLVYVATANCQTDDAWEETYEAVIALTTDDFEVEWTFGPHERHNRNDWDFGATPNLFRDRAGDDVLGIGNKDGTYYALDPDDGTERWRTKVAEPGDAGRDFSIGGFIGSSAAHRGRVYGGTAIGGPPYYHALDGETGEVRWQGAQAPSYGASAVAGGVVFHGALDSVFRARDARSGATLWSAPLAGPISSGPAIAGDTVVVGSGTSSSDACAKDTPPFSEACFTAFEDGLGRTGGVHGFRLATPGPTEGPAATLFSAQDNQLDAYDLSAEPPGYEVFIPNAAHGGKDLNAEICSIGDEYLLLGEDTDQDAGVPQGWGIFDLATRTEVGKLIADYGPTVQPEQYGCEIETDDKGDVERIFVSQVGGGNFEDADGQLIVFFPSSDAYDAVAGRRDPDEVCPDGDCSELTQDQSDFCVVDGDIPTAGGIAMDDDGDLYVAEGAPTVPPDPPAPGRILRYEGAELPSSPDDCSPVEPETFIQDPAASTPVAIAAARSPDGEPTGNWYVSSVLVPSVVNEYDADGNFVRTVLPPGHATPFGLAVDGAGTLYVADLGIDWDPSRIPENPSRLGFDTGSGEGSVLRVRFSGGVPLPPDVLMEDLDFPDGLGILE